MKFTVTITICLLVVLALLVGCGTKAMIDGNDNLENGGLTFSVGDMVVDGELGIRSVTSRWAHWLACQVVVKNDDTQGVLGSVTLTPANPSGSIAGIAGGTPVKVYATLYADVARTRVITTGNSARGTIVAGSNISLPIILTATRPVLTVIAPVNGATVNDDNVVVRCGVVDLGANAPSTVLNDNGIAVPVIPSVTGDTLNGYVFDWALVQTDGSHAMSLVATSTSHVNAGNSGVSAPLNWGYIVNNTGGINVGISSEGG